ncbi:MAG: MFS transporter [Pseudomonadota bacterium]
MTTEAAPARPHLVIAAHGMVMIFTWGSTYYLLAVLAAPIAAETGWSLAAITGALSFGLLVAGLASPLVGRSIARMGGRPVLAAGCVLIAAGLAILGLSTAAWAFWLGWFVLGLGMAGGLYDPAFASLGRLFGSDARRAVTLLTLWGGFASTVCWPLSAFMLDLWGWRSTVFAYAGLHLIGTLPLVLFVIPSVETDRSVSMGRAKGATELDHRERRLFLLMAGVQVLHALIMVSISVFLFVFLQDRGLSLAEAVAIGALMGPAQVAARVVEVAAKGRHHPIWTLGASATTVAAGLLLMAFDLAIAGAAVVLFGTGNGLFSIARGALPLALFGADRYPIIVGGLARPWLIAQAAAPILGAWLIGRFGSEVAQFALSGIALTNLVLVALLWTAVPRVSSGT